MVGCAGAISEEQRKGGISWNALLIAHLHLQADASNVYDDALEPRAAGLYKSRISPTPGPEG